jgi:hypothetical protein
MNSLYWLGAALLGGWLASGYGEKTEATPSRPAPIPPRRNGTGHGDQGQERYPEEPVQEREGAESGLFEQEEQFGRKKPQPSKHEVRTGTPPAKPKKKPAAIAQSDALGLDLNPISRLATFSNCEAEKVAAQEAIRPFSEPVPKTPRTSLVAPPPPPLDFDEELDLLEEGIESEFFEGVPEGKGPVSAKAKKSARIETQNRAVQRGKENVISEFSLEGSSEGPEEDEEEDWLDWAEAEFSEEAMTQWQEFGRKPKGSMAGPGSEFEDLESADPYANLGNIYSTPAGPVRHRQIDTPDGPRNLYTFPDAQGQYPTVFDTPDGPRYVYPGTLPGQTVEAVTERRGDSYFHMSPQRLVDLDSLGLSVE